MVFPSDEYVSIRCLDPEMVWNKGGGGCGMGCNIYKAYTEKNSGVMVTLIVSHCYGN